MAEGTIIGGWGYVIAAYAVTVVVLVAYAWRLARREPPHRNED